MCYRQIQTNTRVILSTSLQRFSFLPWSLYLWRSFRVLKPLTKSVERTCLLPGRMKRDNLIVCACSDGKVALSEANNLSLFQSPTLSSWHENSSYQWHLARWVGQVYRFKGNHHSPSQKNFKAASKILATPLPWIKYNDKHPNLPCTSYK